jgi:hypothetical protein
MHSIFGLRLVLDSHRILERGFRILKLLSREHKRGLLWEVLDGMLVLETRGN